MGVFVEQVEVESPAMQVGIQNGDVIIELNGERIETVKGYQQQLKACKAGSTVKVKAMRQGTEQVGIQNGDVIIELNGERIETVKGYQQQLKACKAGSTVKVKAMRQGTEGYVEVSFDVMLKTR